MYTKKISIEDPFNLKQSLSRNLANLTSKYVVNIIRKSCMYFARSAHGLASGNVVNNSNTYKLIERLIEETGITEARKFSSSYNDSNDEEEEEEEEEQEQEDEDDGDDEDEEDGSTLSSSDNTIGNKSDAEVDNDGEEDVESGGVFADYESLAAVSSNANVDGDNELKACEKGVAKIKLASSESSSVLTSLEHVEIVDSAERKKLAEGDDEIEFQARIKQCLDDIIHTVLSSFDIMPNTNLVSESSDNSLISFKDLFKFTASAIGFSNVSVVFYMYLVRFSTILK
jgi:hypothetical protein